jgi:hypothetical protein
VTERRSWFNIGVTHRRPDEPIGQGAFSSGEIDDF